MCDQFSFGNDPADHPDLNELKTYVESKDPLHVNFTVPYITPEEVNAFLHALDPTKATGIDGLIPRILKMAANSLSPSIASLINNRNMTKQIIDPFSFCQQYRRSSKNILTKI